MDVENALGTFPGACVSLDHSGQRLLALAGALVAFRMFALRSLAMSA